MIEGFCLQHQDNVALDGERYCPTDGSLVLAPSWADQGDVWPAWPPRPEGYAYRAPAHPEPTPPTPPRTATCAQCQQAFAYRERLSVLPRYCGQSCKNRAATARKRVAEKARRAQAATARRRGAERTTAAPRTEMVTCQECGTVAELPHYGGSPRKYCSPACRRLVDTRDYRRPLMAERGMRCTACGRDDRPAKGRGLCASCYARELRKAAAA